MSMKIAKLNGAQSKKLTRAQMLKLVPDKVYDDGRTKQSFKDETDINKIIARAEKSGTISHLNKFKGSYTDFSDFDYFENLQKLTRGREIFDELPANVRNEFMNSPADFFKYVNDPANIDRLETLLPDLAAPGRQRPDVRGNIPADEADARVASENIEEVIPPIEPVATSTGSETRPEEPPST